MTGFSRAYCSQGDHYPEQIIATAYMDPEGEERYDVLQDNSGISLNRFADGVVGVPAEVASEAAMDDEPRCLEHQDCYVDWDHS